MTAHRFCPSWPDACDGCETYPLTPEYRDQWQQAYEDGDLEEEETAQWLSYLASHHAQ